MQKKNPFIRWQKSQPASTSSLLFLAQDHFFLFTFQKTLIQNCNSLFFAAPSTKILGKGTVKTTPQVSDRGVKPDRFAGGRKLGGIEELI